MKTKVTVTVDGKLWTIDEIMLATGKPYRTIHSRIERYKKGLMSAEKLFAKHNLNGVPGSRRTRRKVEINGKTWDRHSLAKHLGISLQLADHRLKKYVRGQMTAEQVLAPFDKQRSEWMKRVALDRREGALRPGERELLAKIPGPTPLEKKYEKELSGGVNWRY